MTADATTRRAEDGPVIAGRPGPVDAERIRRVHADPGFGANFSDHMVTARWNPHDGWHQWRLEPYAALAVDPAAAFLHYSQQVFEGLKAYGWEDGSVRAFLPHANEARLAASARRLALPALPQGAMLRSLEVLVAADRQWIPGGEEQSLYLRPVILATEPFFGVRPSREVQYLLVASPSGSYFGGTGVRPVSIWLSQGYVRAAPGGLGAAKCGANYGGSMVAQMEAAENECDQVCFLDAVERRWVEELGGMNLFFVHADGRVTTPPLTGTILPGVTRAAILELAREAGHRTEEAAMDIDTWRAGAAEGSITEVFACGTAAVITPVARLRWPGAGGTQEVRHGGGHAGPVTLALRRRLVDLQYGRVADTHGWLTRLA